MKLNIKGGSKFQRKLAKMVSQFMTETYFPRHRTIEVDLRIEKKLERIFDVSGICFYKTNRDYKIRIDGNLSTKDFIEILIHEIVHVKQYVYRELIDRTRGKVRTIWKGEDHTNTKYHKQPWELEAFELQKSLYYKFLIWDIEKSGD